MAEWTRLVDKKGKLAINGKSCTSITKECCQAVVCAPSRTNVRVRPDEVIEKMAHPMTTLCMFGRKGAVWHDGKANLYVQMLRPRSRQCSA